KKKRNQSKKAETKEKAKRKNSLEAKQANTRDSSTTAMTTSSGTVVLDDSNSEAVSARKQVHLNKDENEKKKKKEKEKEKEKGGHTASTSAKKSRKKQTTCDDNTDLGPSQDTYPNKKRRLNSSDLSCAVSTPITLTADPNSKQVQPI
ncbi:hypothetical protein RFI_33572, partial [Reticulomyxa filosa]